MKQWHCKICNLEWSTGDHVVSMFHECREPRRHSDLSRVAALRETVEERRALWFQLVMAPGKDTETGGRGSDGNAA